MKKTTKYELYLIEMIILISMRRWFYVRQMASVLGGQILVLRFGLFCILRLTISPMDEKMFRNTLRKFA